MSFFEIHCNDKNSLARTGIIHTEHGDINTPAFMPVGTQATVKSLDSQDILNLGADVILANTYHLHLRPGEELIAKFGGIHKFMNWKGPILTDSGGFQVFSLNNPAMKKDLKSEQCRLVKIDSDGVTFRSHIDGSEHRFSPESAIKIQHKLGADIIMAFDECTPDKADEKYTLEAMNRTHAWAGRCIVEHKKNTKYHGYKQYLFGIIQGSNHKKLRQESTKIISSMDFDGIAIGGESIGYNMEATEQILDWINPLLPIEKPHYTMGVGFAPQDIFRVVEKGIDMFDCVAPTRMARNGTLYVNPKTNKKGRLIISNAECKNDKNPIDKTCGCPTCQNYSRAYLHHLFKAEELLAYRLATIHNLHFMLNLMNQIREAIEENKFMKLKKKWV